MFSPIIFFYLKSPSAVTFFMCNTKRCKKLKKGSWECRSKIFVNIHFCWNTLHKYVLKAQCALGGFGKTLDCLDKWHFIASRCL